MRRRTNAACVADVRTRSDCRGDGMRLVGGFTRARALTVAAVLVLVAALVTQVAPRRVGASTLPTGFRDSVVLSGLTNPTVVQFAPDGRIFVGQKNGMIKVFRQPDRHDADGRSPTCPREVDDYWDRGLLGLALDPNFPTDPYVYVLYTLRRPARRYRARPGTTAARRRPARPPTAVSSPARRVAADGQRATSMTGHRAGARQRLVPAVPEPLDRHAACSAATARSTSAAATARASTTSTTASTARRTPATRRTPAATRRRPPAPR